MSGPADLRDRLYAEMLASERSWSSDEIARAAFRIVSDAGRADRLVGAVLSADPRFVRDDAGWRAIARAQPRLDESAFLLCDLPSAAPGAAPPPLFVRAWDRGRSRPGEIVAIDVNGDGLARAAGLLEGRLATSLAASAVRRRFHHLERQHALPAASERLLDLAAAARLAGWTPAGVAPISPEDRLEETHACLERVLLSFGSLPVEALEERIAEAMESTPVRFDPFSFTRDDLAALPERPGVYRFLGEGGRLLYVGKSRDLRRRVGSYFRPLAPDHRRRAELLAGIRDLVWEVVPCELEALLIEAETIRAEHPIFNQKLEIRPAPDEWTPAEDDLAYILWDGDPGNVSVFLFRGRRPWARGRIPSSPPEAALRAAVVLAHAWGDARRPAPPGILKPLDETGGTLVRRHLRLRQDRADRLRLSEYGAVEQLAESLAALAIRPRPAWEPWSIRAAPC